MEILHKNIKNAFFSGICGAVGSLFGKLSGGLAGYEHLWILNIIFFILMLTFNTISLTSFVKALQDSNSTLKITLVSSSTNYLLSGIFGKLIFNEVITLLWWSGTIFILIGLVLLSEDLRVNDSKKSE